jgi:virginiamycin B lyase
MRSGVWWVAVFMAAAPGIASADPQPETITGSGTVLATTYSLSVSGGPYGQDPTGSLKLSGAYNFDATATCMSNGGQDGVAGFRIDDGPNAGEGFLTESASPGSPVDPVDSQDVLWSGILPVPPTVCPPPGSPEPSFVSSAGGGSVDGNLMHSGGPVDPIPMQDQEFGTQSGSAPQEIAQSPGGTLWFTEPAADRIGSIADDQSGDMQEHALPPGSAPSSIAPDLSGACSSSGCSDAGMWFTEPAADRIGHISASGTVRTYAVPAGADPRAIGGDVNGGAWFTEPGDDGIGYISESGQVSSYRLPAPDARPAAISADSGATGAAGDGAWFTQAGADSIGYVDATGQITEHPLPSGSGDPAEIVTDGGSPAGAWFTETGTATIGHIDAGGQISEDPLPAGDADPQGLAAGVGPSGNYGGAWFTQPSVGHVGYLSPYGQVQEFTVPGDRPAAIALAPVLGVPATDGYTSSEGLWWADPASGSVGVGRFPLGTPLQLAGTQEPEPQSRAEFSAMRQVVVRRSAMRLTIRCQGSIACQGHAVLLGTSRRRAHLAPVFATARFSVGVHRRRVLQLRLSRFSRRQLAAHRRGVTAELIVQSNHRSVETRHPLTLRLPG